MNIKQDYLKANLLVIKIIDNMIIKHTITSIKYIYMRVLV